MAQYRILLTDRAWPDCSVESEVLSEINGEVIEASDTSEEALARAAKDVDAILACWAPITAKVIDASPNLRVISRIGIGLDNIDIPHATKRGIPVTNVPVYCNDEVAEHTLAMLLSMARNIAFFHQRTKSGEYDLQAAPAMHRVAGQTLGIIGLGNIGRALAQKANALGLRVIAASRSQTNQSTDCEIVSLDELLAQSDFVSINVALVPETNHLMNAAAFAKMKRTAAIINTSRGPVVDNGALLEALDSGQIAGAALDVFDPEPPDLSDPLYKHERVIATPHAAFLSVESLISLRTQAAKNALDVLSGNMPANVVNSI